MTASRACRTCGEVKGAEGFPNSKYLISQCRKCTGKHNVAMRKATFLKNGVPSHKQCGRCCRVVPAKEFSRNRSNSDGLQGMCKPCTSLYMRRRGQTIKRKQADNPEKMAACLTCSTSKPLSEFLSGSSSRCKACVAEYMRTRLATDDHLRIRNALRSRMWYAVKRGKRPATDERTEELIGCSILALKEHIEKQFKPGMTWSNWGCLPDQWELDHRRPCKSFDLDDLDQRKQCFHYTNLQPLWMPENRSKSYLWDADAQ